MNGVTITPKQLLLQALVEGPDYGLGLIDRINKRCGAEVLHQGNTYTLLRDMEQEGLLTSDPGAPLPERNDRPRMFYKLTDKGAETARDDRNAIMSLLATTSALLALRAPPRDMEDDRGAERVFLGVVRGGDSYRKDPAWRALDGTPQGLPYSGNYLTSPPEWFRGLEGQEVELIVRRSGGAPAGASFEIVCHREAVAHAENKMVGLREQITRAEDQVLKLRERLAKPVENTSAGFLVILRLARREGHDEIVNMRLPALPRKGEGIVYNGCGYTVRHVVWGTGVPGDTPSLQIVVKCDINPL